MNSRSGFSLLEMILALGLTVVLLSAITAATRMYLFQLERQSQEIERRLIARGAIRMVTEDVRSAIQDKPEDYAALEDLVASQNLAGFGAGGATAGAEDDIDAEQLEQQILDSVSAQGGPSTPTAGEGGEGEAEEESDEEEEEPLGRPTFVGTQSFIRLDISRLPRLDEYNPLVIRRSSDIRLPSDVKTVTYFFSSLPPTQTDELDQNFGRRGGLYRREVDRAVESFENGDADIEIVVNPDEFSELVSPEISSIEFRYWDGEDWLVEWDSSEMNGFPSAVELAIVIDPERFALENSLQDIRNLNVEIIRTVIHIPVAEIIPDEEETEAAEEDR